MMEESLESLTDGDLIEFYEHTLDGSRGHIDKFYRNIQFAAEIDRRVSAYFDEELDDRIR